MGIKAMEANKIYFLHYLSQTSQIVSYSSSELKTSITVNRNCHFQIFVLNSCGALVFKSIQEKILMYISKIQISKN